MNKASQSFVIRTTISAASVGKILLWFVLSVVIVPSLFSQGQVANGTISSSGTGPYFYSLSFSDAPGSTAPIGSVWYAWVPGFFYLPGPPSSASAPVGWTANISGHSIQFVANSSADDILPGRSLSGFSYLASFTPAQLAAASNSGLSVAYSAGLFSDSGFTFTVQAVPEPSMGILFVSGAIGLLLSARRKLAVA
jgi:hypothetical protein